MADLIEFFDTLPPLAVLIIFALVLVDSWLLWLILRGWRE